MAEEYYDEFSRPSGNERPEVERERICTEAIELTPNGQTVALMKQELVPVFGCSSKQCKMYDVRKNIYGKLSISYF